MKSTIGRKIAFAFLVLLALMAAMVGIMIQGFDKVTSSLDNLEREAVKRGASGNLRFSIAQLLMATNDYIITQNELYQREYNRLSSRANEFHEQFLQLPLTEEEQQLLVGIKQDLDSIRSYSTQIFTIQHPRQSPKAWALMETMDYRFGEDVNRKTTEIFDGISRRIEQHRLLAAANKENASNSTYAILFLGTLLGLLTSYLTVQRISKPIVSVTKAANGIANGDYSQRPVVKTHDEVAVLAESFCRMAESIQQSQRALEASKHLTESIVATVPSGLLVFGSDGKILSVNNSFCNIFGLARDVFIDEHLEPVIKQLGVSEECRSHILAREPVRDIEYTYSDPTKGARILNLTLFPIRLTDGESLLIIEDITRRKLSEQIIVDNEKRFRSLIEHSSDGLAIISRDGSLLYQSLANSRILGYAHGELLSANVFALIHPDDLPMAMNLFAELLNQPSSIVVTEQRVKHKDGTWRWIEATANNLLHEPTIGGVVANFRDITERKHAEQQMKQLSSVVEQTADCVIVTDRKGVIQYVNAAFEKETGYSRAEALGKTPRFLKSGEHNPRFYEVLWETILAGNDFKAVFINRNKAGELFYEQKTITPLKDSKGNVTHFVSTAKNITEQRRAEEALRESEKQYRDLFESTSDLIQAVAPDGRLLFANRAWREAFGYTEEELIDLNIDRVVHPEALTQCFETLQRAMSGEKVDRIEIRFVTKDGKSIIVEGSMACRFEASQPVAVTCFLRDITERREAEEVLRHSRDLLNLTGQMAKVGGWELDMETQTLSWTEEIYRIHEIDPVTRPNVAEAINFYAPEARPVIANAVQAGIDSGTPWDLELPLITAQGRRIWVRAYGQAERRGGKTVRLYGAFQDITNRKQAEEVLSKSRASLAEAQRIAHVGNWDWNVVANELSWSDEVYRIFGLSPQEFGATYEAFLSSVHLDDREFVKTSVNEALYENKPYSIDHRIVLPDGSERIVHEQAEVFFDDGGRPTRMVGTVQDITGRKRAEQEREILYAIGETVNTTSSLNEMLQSIHHNIKKVMYAENCYVALYDSSTETMSFPFFVDQFDSTPAPRAKRRGLTEYVLRTANQLLLTSELLDELVRNNEVEIIGTPPESWLGVPLFIQSKPIGVLVVQSYEPGKKYTDRAKDMLVAIGNQAAAAIDRKRAENERAELLNVLETSLNEVYIFDPDSLRFRYVNQRALRNLGYTREAMSAMTPLDLKPEFDQTSFRNLIGPLLRREKENLVFHTVHRRADGSLYFIEVHLQLSDFGGKLAFHAIILDITEKKKLEEQFRQAQKLESLGTLTSGIAHDFNNILGIIMGHSSLMERHKADPQKLLRSIEAIMKATQRGASLVKQLLTFARKTEALFESVSINDMIREINKLIQETFPKTITISTSLQHDLPVIVADASQMHQVLLNLCVNARDAMPKKGTLSISTDTVEGESVSVQFPKATARQYVRIEVADTGIGMDEATRQRMFEPFFTTKDIGKGTGLGLAVVFGVIENHNGFIDVQSKLGEGTTFTIYLPISERTPEVSQLIRQAVEEIPGGTETLLLIEDEEMLRELLKTILVSKGYTVLTAEDGMQGVEMYQSHQKEIAVVLSDIGLPILSGQDVLKRIREMNPEAKVILASGFINPETKSEMYKSGAKRFIQKPYSHDEVLQKIREVIDTNL